MARPTHTPEQKAAIRQQIRSAASALYAQDGLKVTARRVAEEAGVSVGTIYSYFGSLSDLMQSLWREPLRRLVAAIGAGVLRVVRSGWARHAN